MSYYKPTVCQSISQLVNLTSKSINVYASDGTLLTYEPKGQELPAYNLGTYYAVTKEQYNAAEEQGRYTTDLVAVESIGQGRDGVQVFSLRLFDDPKVRVYPVNRKM